MRARTALRVVALVSTLAGSMALPSAAAAATSKKTTAKSSSKKTSSSKASASKSSSKSKSKSTATAKASGAKTTGSSSSGSAAKAALDPMAPATSIPAAPATASAGGAPPQRGPTRIDFDDRLIQGQTNKSGAVYLYDRKELKQRSMIKKRETFREEIVGAVYDSEL